ncbi:type II secretion system protein [Clostridium malenominatum]|uniref:Type II secretion system protein n=1 Tax=Clostridium malenominatum TaxID=1539 RepID=A0ABN1IYB6_9CLOT
MIKRKKKGFTLVELLVVMSIIFVFMSMIIPKFSGYRDKANFIKAENVGKQIYTAAMMSYVESGGKFRKDKLEESIKELVDILSITEDGEIGDGIKIEQPEDETVKVTLSLDSKIYNLSINPERYSFEKN